MNTGLLLLPAMVMLLILSGLGWLAYQSFKRRNIKPDDSTSTDNSNLD